MFIDMIVYCITNKINGKKYIGSDSNNNPNYYGSGVYIKKAIKKYGKSNFKKEILCQVNNLELMKELEEYWIEYFNAYNNPLFYNATKYSAGITSFPEEKKINVSKANKGNKYNLGRQLTESHKQQILKANLGKKHTIEYKKAKREQTLGNRYALGYKFTDEQKAKISEAKKGHKCYQNVERNSKISRSISKPIIQYALNGDFIKEWPNAKEAALYLKKSSSSAISQCLNKKAKSAYKFIWEFK